MKYFYLDIKPRHIKGALRGNSRHCPVARAAAEQCEAPEPIGASCEDIWVGGSYMRPVALCSKALGEQVRRFDDTGKFRPGRYRLTVVPWKQETP